MITPPVLLIALGAYGLAFVLFPVDGALSSLLVTEAGDWRVALDRLSDVALLQWYFYPALAMAVILLLSERRAADPLDGLAAHLTVLVATLGAATTLTHLLKWTLGRARPALMEAEGSLSFALWRVGEAFESFPSGHSTNAGVVSMMLAVWFPRLRWPFLLLGASIAATRVPVGAHFSSDVVAGLATGLLTALAGTRFLALRGTLYHVSTGGEGWRGLFPGRRP